MQTSILTLILSAGVLAALGVAAQPPSISARAGADPADVVANAARLAQVGAEDGRRAHGRRHGPPQAAFVACEAAVAGDACTFTAPHGEVTGTCFLPPRGEALACRPASPPPHEQRPDDEYGERPGDLS